MFILVYSIIEIYVCVCSNFLLTNVCCTNPFLGDCYLQLTCALLRKRIIVIYWYRLYIFIHFHYVSCDPSFLLEFLSILFIFFNSKWFFLLVFQPYLILYVYNSTCSPKSDIYMSSLVNFCSLPYIYISVFLGIYHVHASRHFYDCLWYNVIYIRCICMELLYFSSGYIILEVWFWYEVL